MKIAVVGAGRVGTALGERWTSLGHDVTYGVRNPDTANDGPGRKATVAEAVRTAELVLLATPWEPALDAVRAMGDVSGKIIVDATNPLIMGPGGLAMDPKAQPSGAAMIAGVARGAHVVKAFNQTGYENMADASRFLTRPLMLVAGDDTAAKSTVSELADRSGFQAVDAGPLAHATHLEHLAFIWIDLVFRRGQPRDIAFALLRPQAKA